MPDNPEISVVIAKSRPFYLETVRSLSEQNCEIIVINGDRGISEARNRGLERARGGIVVFIDDDAVAHPNYINDLVREFKETGADIVGGLILPLGKVPLWFPTELHSLLAINPVSRDIYGCNFAVRRGVFETLNFRFNENLGRRRGDLAGGDESELLLLAKKQGVKVVRTNRVIVYHKVTPERQTYRYFVRRVFWDGYTEAIRQKFARHLFLGVATLVLSAFRWVVYATSFIYYLYGGLRGFLKKGALR